MSKPLLFYAVFLINLSVLSAQEIGFSEKELIGCWELSNDTSSNQVKTYFPCNGKATGQIIRFNSYREYSIYVPSTGKCGTKSPGSSGRFIFDAKNQTLKLIDRTKQKTFVWKVSKNASGSISIDKNYPQQRI